MKNFNNKNIQQHRYNKNSNSKNNNNAVLGVVFGLLAIAVIGYLTINPQLFKQNSNPNTEQLKEKKKVVNKLSKRQLIKNQPKAITYLAAADRIAIKRKRVNKDTSFMVAKFLQVTIHKKYYMSIIKDDELPVLAISRGYSFIHNKVKSDNSKSLTMQWFDLRKSFSPDFSYTIIKKYVVEDMKVEEVNFIIPGPRNVYGVAKLIEIGDERFFFHFAFKQETPDYNMLRKYLNYYVVFK